MKSTEILELFKQISKSHINRNESPKSIAIQSYLNEKNIKNEFIKEIGIVVNPVEKPRLILVSHFDLIHKFNKAFENQETPYELEIYIDKLKAEKKGKTDSSIQYIKGALDNTITNSVAILLMEELLKNGITDVELILTEEEEIGMIGMSKYIQKFRTKSKSSFFINLDVTNDGWNSSGSLEYDKPSPYEVKELQKILSKKVYFTGERVCDDIDAVNQLDCNGFSFCLPTKGTIHSFKNETKVSTLNKYYSQLKKLMTDFVPSKLKSKTVSSYKMNSILEAKDYKSYKKEQKRILKSYKNESKKYLGNDTTKPSNYGPEDFNPYSPNFSDIVKKSNKKDKIGLSETEKISYVNDLVEFEIGCVSKGNNEDRDFLFKVFWKLCVIDRKWYSLDEIASIFNKNEQDTLTSLLILESVGALENDDNKLFRFHKPMDI